MPTIAEIIAARSANVPRAGHLPPSASPAVSAPKINMAEQVELTEAIDRIDLPGKRRGSLVLDSKPTPPPAIPAEPRMMGARVGETLNVMPENPTAQATAWDAVLNRWETDLIIMADPEPGSESAWLALKPGTGGGLPVLLHKLPFWPHPARKHLDNGPF